MQRQENDSIPYNATKTVNKGKTLVFAPHPDDEVFGCGGAIIRHIQQGDTVKVVIVTDGGLVVDKKQEITEYTKIRKEESIKAARILEYDEPVFLNYPDGGLINDGKLVSHLLEIISQFQPQNIYLPAATEMHPDHLALSKAVTEAARNYKPDVDLIHYEIGQMQSANLLLNITDLHDQLDQAMDSFVSQLEVQNYKFHINALHAYRTYTLGKEVKYAEAYNLINSRKIKTGSQLWKQKTTNIDLPTKSKPSGEENPLISVIVRTMNRPELAEALKSLSKQTYSNVEVIVVDALGTGNLDLGNKCGAFPLRVISKNKQLQRPAAANAGLQTVNGEYFCFLDEDDLLLPEHIKSLYELLKNSDSQAAYSNIKRVNNKNELLNIYDDEFNLSKLLWNNFIPIHALLIRTKPVQDNCLFDDNFEVYEDWDFLIQISLLGDLAHLNIITGIYRDTNTSGVQSDFEKVNKYRTLLFKKWKGKLTSEHYIGLLNYLSNLNLHEKELFKNKYTKELNKFEEAQDVIKTLLENKRQSLIKEKNILDEKEAEIALRDKEVLNKDNRINVFISEIEMLSKSINKKDSIISQKNDQIDEAKNKLVKLNKSLMEKEELIYQKNIYTEETQFALSELSHQISDKDKLLVEQSAFIEKANDELTNLNQQLNLHKSTIINLTKSFSWRITKPLRFLKNNNLRRRILLGRNIEKVKLCGLFDEEYYLKNNEDVRLSRDNPLKHFILYGGFEGRRPGPEFDIDYYNSQNPDVVASGLNPLLHYILYGKEEERQIIQEKESI